MSAKKYDRPGKKKPYGIRYGHWKNPKTIFFTTTKERDSYMRKLLLQEKEEGIAATQMSAYEVKLFRKCVELVGSTEQLLVLCESTVNKKSLKHIPIENAVAEFIEEKFNIGRSSYYLGAHRNILSRFATAHPGRALHELTEEDARCWVLSLAFSPVTLRNHKKSCSTFFNWAEQRGYVFENIFRKVPLPDIIRPEPEFLTNDQTRAMFEATVDAYPDALAYLSLSAFAGLRSSMCERLENDHIDFEQRGILIRAENAKNKRRIFVDGHPDNLWQWLEYAKEIAPEGFELSKRIWGRRKEQLAKKTGFRMPHNALRHSFCTYHVALHGDAGKTATLLTHRGNVAILYEHYKGNAAKASAEAYFSIAPDRM